MKTIFIKLLSVIAGLLVAGSASAVIIKDSFLNDKANNSWIALGDACLTAGTSLVGDSRAGLQISPNNTLPVIFGPPTIGSNRLTGENPTSGNAGGSQNLNGINQPAPGNPSVGIITKCSAPNDANGSGALRLTPATYYPRDDANGISHDNNQAGAILSNFTFPTSQGIQITFITYTYAGNSYAGGNQDNLGNHYGPESNGGADGMSFFLTDGTKPAPTQAGAPGGSLGYSCSNSNSPYDGVANGYLGLGIDEYGSFLDKYDNTHSGVLNSFFNGVEPAPSSRFGNESGGANSVWHQANRIGLRGAGNVNLAWYKTVNPNADSTLYIIGLCKKAIYDNAITGARNITIPFDYNAIPLVGVLPSSSPISNERAQTRAAATPITYKLILTTGSKLYLYYSYGSSAFRNILSNQDIRAQSGDLPASFRFGFAGGTGAGTNVHEITCFSASPLISNSSVGGNTVLSAKVIFGSQIFLATYSADNWWGTVLSEGFTGSGATFGISPTSNWDANCLLTSGACPSMGTDPKGVALTSFPSPDPAPDSRVLLTSSAGGIGMSFGWASLNSAQQTLWNNADAQGKGANEGEKRYSWLRGDRSNEEIAVNESAIPGDLRARNFVMGDVISSSPTFVGPPAAGYPDVFVDSVAASGDSFPENAVKYSTFKLANSARPSVVYSGSNDGFLHGFAAGLPGGTATAPTYTLPSNNGSELIGYMPASVFGSTDLFNLTTPTYSHSYFVDATPSATDLFYKNAWHTWLVGGVGSGGSEIYALDVTDPSQFSVAHARSLVIGDWSNATLPNLGKTVGTPIIARMHNGQWAIIFGNGLGSNTEAGIYVGLVDSNSGAVTFQYMTTGVAGTAANPEGIVSVTPADLDDDSIVDYLYAGDVQGNVWRFDVTSADSTKWGASNFGVMDAGGGPKATPLFVAKLAAIPGTPAIPARVQPITTAVAVKKVAVGGGLRVIVMFGTGQKTPFAGLTGDVFATGTQTVYGVWDWDMTAWNLKAHQAVPLLALIGQQTADRTKLLVQTSTTTTTTSGSGANSEVFGYRYLSTGSVVCWDLSATCPVVTAANPNTQFGWLFDLPVANEQIIYNPSFFGTQVEFNTAIPAVISASQCIPGLQAGWTMAFDPGSGGAIPKGFFADASGGQSTAAGPTAVAGIQLNGVGTASSVTSGTQQYLITQGSNGTGLAAAVFPPKGISPSPSAPRGPGYRASWKELREH